MANNKNLILKNAVEVGGSTSMTIGSAPTVGSFAVGYDLSVAAYDSVSLSSITAPRSLYFKADGTKMYVLGKNTGTNEWTVYQFTLSTAFDLSTASYSNISFSVNSQEATAYGMSFKPDGTKMYIVGDATDTVYQFTLSTAFDLSTASYDSVSFSVSGQIGSGRKIAFNNDGYKMYVLGGDTDAVYQYSLSTAYIVNTASYDSVSFSVTNEEAFPAGMAFSNDGTKMYICGNAGDDVNEYNLSTAWNISTAVYSQNFSVSGQDSNPQSIMFNTDGTKMYVAGTSGNVYQYTTGSTLATNVFDVSTGNYFATTPSVSAQYEFSNAGDTQTWQLEVTGNQDVVGYDLSNAAYDSVVSPALSSTLGTGQGLFFKPDGTKMYANDGTTLFQYALSTAWDISTIVYESKSFTIPAGGSNVNDPWDCFFKPDGTIVYFVSRGSSEIFAFGLGTAWDVSTGNSTYLSKLSSTGTSPNSVFFKPDGTKMYIIAGNDDVKGYSLSTAWDLSSISSGTYTTFHAGNQIATPRTLDFSSDGLKMYIAGTNPTKVFEYDLSTAWDASSSSVSYNSIDLALSTYPQYPYGLFFKTDGTKMYVLGGTTDIIHQYTTAGSVPITITWDADIQWAGGTAPDSPANGEKDLYTITTDDAGTSYVGVQSGDNFS